MKNYLPFNIDDIIELATDSSFERGEDYYNMGYVEEIVRDVNRFEGTVSGTYKYKVNLDIENDELNFYCSSPYDHGGICKHEVALALAILNGEYTEKHKIYTHSKEIKPESFKKYFKNADTKKKLNFLKQLLDKDSDLQSQFIEFVKSTTGNLDHLTGVNIITIKEKVFNELASLDFNDIVEDYNQYEYGYYDDEGYIDLAYDMIKDIFDTYNNQAKKYIKKGNLLDAFRIISGMYEGSQNLPELDNDDYYIFDGDYNDRVYEFLTENLNDLGKEIEQIVKSEESILQVIDLIIQRFNYYLNQYTEDEEEEEDQQIRYNLKDFEKLFIALITNEKIANYLHKTIRENDLDCLAMSFVLLKIAEITENEELWTNTAENFAEFEQEITKQLLEKYKQKKQENNFNRIAELAFDKWASSFDFYLINNLNKETQKELYVKALKSYVVNKQNVKYYKELRKYLTEDEKKEFVDRIGQGYYDVFYIQLLDIEKRHKDILVYAKNQLHNSYNFEKIIAPIANIYSDECFDMIKTKCNNALNSPNRNRKTYKQMVKWLKVMQQIVSKQTETIQYLRTLYNYKPNLPALKDEIKNAGLYY